MSNLKNNDPSMFVTSTHRIIFPHLDKPHKFEDDDSGESNEPKYDCTFLIPKNHADVGAFMTSLYAIHAAESMTTFKGMPIDLLGHPDGIWCPLRDGDAHADKMVARGKDPALYEAYRGHWFLKATSKAEFAPTVFQQLPGQGRVEVIDIAKEMYGGCYARGVLKILAWFNKGKYGFSVFINSVLKTAEGPKLGGGGGANPNDYDFGVDTTDHSTLLQGEAPLPTNTAGLPMPPVPGVPTPAARPTVPGSLPTMPGAAPVPPAAQRPALPSMTPPAMQAPQPVAPPAPVMPAAPAPVYGQWEGRNVVSYDNGVNWEYVN